MKTDHPIFKTVCFLFLLLMAAGLFFGCTQRQTEDTQDYSSDLKDGKYTVQSRYYDSAGYKQSYTISVNKGIITRVSLTQTDHTGAVRQDKPKDAQNWESTEISYAQALAELYNATILSQGAKITSVDQAPKLTELYKLLNAQALKCARAGSPNNMSLDTFSDTYTAKNDPDPLSGSQEVLTAEFSDGVLTNVECTEVTNNAAFYAIGKEYAALAAVSKSNQNLSDVVSTAIDPSIVARYNALLKSIRDQRGE